MADPARIQNETEVALPGVSGWGVDLARENRPGVPRELNRENVLMRGREPAVTKQVPRRPVLKTVERNSVTPVFGTTCPLRGLSGVVRRFAFRFSEDRARHWFLLVFADRLDMVEGWFSDLAHGRMPMLLPRM